MKLSHVERDENEDDKNEEEKGEEKREWNCKQCNYVAGSRKTLWR